MNSSPRLSPKQSATPLVIILSHAHAPPLNPAANLTYDLRTVPNPPKAIRDSYTGVDKRLREHMRQHDAFRELLVRAEGDIKEALAVLIGERGDGQVAVEDGGEDDDDESHGDESHVDDDEHEINDEVDENHANDGPVLRVGVFCARGQHRSVAFVEELARLDWPRDWEVRVLHRDLGKERGGGKGGRGRGKRGGKASEMDFVRDGGREWD
jgi:RNase adaptor protein for sRNA GlmZ degradation